MAEALFNRDTDYIASSDKEFMLTRWLMIQIVSWHGRPGMTADLNIFQRSKWPLR
jgi:hypothetical protein